MKGSLLETNSAGVQLTFTFPQKVGIILRTQLEQSNQYKVEWINSAEAKVTRIPPKTKDDFEDCNSDSSDKIKQPSQNIQENADFESHVRHTACYQNLVYNATYGDPLHPWKYYCRKSEPAHVIISSGRMYCRARLSPDGTRVPCATFSEYSLPCRHMLCASNGHFHSFDIPLRYHPDYISGKMDELLPVKRSYLHLGIEVTPSLQKKNDDAISARNQDYFDNSSVDHDNNCIKANQVRNSAHLAKPQTSFSASSNDFCKPYNRSNILHRCAWDMVWSSVSSQNRNFFHIFDICERVTKVLFSVKLKKHKNMHFQSWLLQLAKNFPHIEIPHDIGNTPSKLLESIGKAIFKFLHNSFEQGVFNTKLQILQSFQDNLPKDGFSNDYRCRSEYHSRNVFK